MALGRGRGRRTHRDMSHEIYHDYEIVHIILELDTICVATGI